jgi:transcriptional regulator with XRE-family HTH domain
MARGSYSVDPVEEDDLQRVVGRNLRRLRRASGLSQEAFAESLGYQRGYIAQVERGERNLTLRTVARLALQLKVDPLTLLSDPEPGVEEAPRKRGRPKLGT